MSDPTQHERWFKVVSNLRVDRKYNIAPHKPLLLLVVVDLAEEGVLTSSELPLTGELVFRFLAFWAVVAKRRSQRPDIYLPFYHMHSDGCWVSFDVEGKPAQDRRRAVVARLDESFLACLFDAGFRKQLRQILIAKYFKDPGERAALYDLVQMPVPPDDVVKADANLYGADKERGREARFRLTVVPAYNYTCALSGYRCVTVDAGSIVDAAHIHQFASSRNNHPQNGIALCKNAHWLFDQGLWSISKNFRVLVAEHRFNEAGEEGYLLKRMAGRELLRPSNPSFMPDQKCLEWHRRRHKFDDG